MVGLDPDRVDLYQFIYEGGLSAESTNCGDMELFVNPLNDLNGVFEARIGTSDQNCEENSGSSTFFPPPTICDRIMELRVDPNTWYAQLRQLLGRYFAQHGPRQLPDCFLCEPTELISMEAELRLSNSSQAESGIDGVQDFRSVAENHYDILGGDEGLSLIHISEPTRPY